MIGVLAILGGIFAIDQNIAFLVALAFAVAASANLPTIVYSLFWKRFNTSGALWSMYGGLISCMVLIIFSPVVCGKVDARTGKSLSMIKDTGDRLLRGSRSTTRASSRSRWRSSSATRHRGVEARARDRRALRRDGGAFADRVRRREGCRPLGPTPGTSPARRLSVTTAALAGPDGTELGGLVAS